MPVVLISISNQTRFLKIKVKYANHFIVSIVQQSKIKIFMILVITGLLLLPQLRQNYLILHVTSFNRFLKTDDNQFGFKPNHSTDMSVFPFKQVA